MQPAFSFSLVDKKQHLTYLENMARVTVEDSLQKVGNHFALVILAAERVRRRKKGAPALVDSDNREAVTALREIAEGRVSFTESVQEKLEAYLEEIRSRGTDMPLRTTTPVEM